MYQASYIYRVPVENIDRFLRVVTEAGEIYCRHGALSSVTLRVTAGATKYGCTGLCDLVPPAGPDEALFVGLDSFREVEEFRAKMKLIDSNPRIGELFEEIQSLIDLKKIIRWEAESAGHDGV